MRYDAPRLPSRIRSRCARTLWPTAISLALLASGCALSKAEETEERSIPLKPGQGVLIKTRNGRITIRTGTAGRVLVKVQKRARASSNPEALVKEIKVKVTSGAERLTVEAEHPSGSLSKQYGAHFEVAVPPGTAVTAETRNGAIRVTGAVGAVVAETRNGAVSLEDAGAEARLSTRNGAVNLSGRPTRFTLTSNNGAVRVRLSPGAALAGASSARTKNGSVTLEAPAGFRGRIEASTRNGRVKSDFPLGGEARPGEPSIGLQTRNGSIRIRKR